MAAAPAQSRQGWFSSALTRSGARSIASCRRVVIVNADVTPTILHLLGHPKAATFDGRVLHEALVNGPDEEQVATETRTLRVANGTYRAVLQVTEAAGRRYLDKSWRE